jgi:NlpC/P60 family putative phage cell wall peptidase
MSSDLIITIARSWIGTPYMHQASVKGVGCDCLGLLRGVWRELHGQEPELPPPYSADWAEARGRETLVEAAGRHLLPLDLTGFGPADVILFRWREGSPAKHCAIATSPETMVHAHDGASVAEVGIGRWWRRHVAYAFRFPALG